MLGSKKELSTYVTYQAILAISLFEVSNKLKILYNKNVTPQAIRETLFLDTVYSAAFHLG